MFYEVLSNNVNALLTVDIQTVSEITRQFYLGGGTALALQLGHRESDDLDFFCEQGFDSENVAVKITQLGGEIRQESSDTLHASLAGVKLSFFHYPYPLIGSKKSIGRVSVASIEDIACMKVIAIGQRAEKKYFFDMYEILKRYSPAVLKEMVMRKYGEKRINCYHVVKSFFYHEGAERSLDPMSLNNTNWQQVKEYFMKNENDLVAGLCRGIIES